ncbi:hypothetical protein CFOL_v3_30902 [Cephalotus follicularis]|uniref:RVT_1 domain-containing protein n=1 Tax=Cephalotus follicularis TaxID=3775 RepID=A0A1Q3D4P2_CEPFO|nr:hypothetical protein CFOL_v3_30902 [Cephalotus follicularis]
MVFSMDDRNSLAFIKDTLEQFYHVSGMAPNLEKSQIFYGNVGPSAKKSITDLIRIKEGTLPVRYLGVPLIATRLGLKECIALVEQMVKRVRTWACNYLCFRGRLQLISSTLFSMQVFWCKTFVLPAAVIENCEWIIRSFLWFGAGDAKRARKVAWAKVCHPKEEGGLGIKSIRA